MPVEQRQGPAPEIPNSDGTRWAVVIGVSKHKDTSLDLEFADRDAQEFYDFIRSPDGGEFKEDNVVLLINEEATVAAINRAFRRFLKKPAKEDLVVIYLACHGSPDPDLPENVYLLTHDIDSNDITSGVPIDEIHRAVKNMQAERVVIFADACHSASIGGAVGKSRAARDATMVNTHITQLTHALPGVALLTSCEAAQVSIEDKRWGGGHGVFTHFLLEGMRGAADTQPKNGTVTVGELFEYVRDNVKEATNHLQHPSIGQGQFDRGLPISTPGLSRSRDLEARAGQKFEEGKLDDAEELWAEALKLDAGNRKAENGLAKIARLRERRKEDLARQRAVLVEHERSGELSVAQLDRALAVLRASEKGLDDQDQEFQRRVVQLADREIAVDTYLELIEVLSGEPTTHVVETPVKEKPKERKEEPSAESLPKTQPAAPSEPVQRVDPSSAADQLHKLPVNPPRNRWRSTAAWLLVVVGAGVLAWLLFSPLPPQTEVLDVAVEDGSSAKSYEPELVLIPAGSFMMGSPEGEPGRDEDEGPMREVNVPSFKMSRHEITFEEYDAFAEATKRKLPSDSSWGRGKRPVINVSWNDAQAYVSWLREKTGRTYRLPTEAEWEYAARAGTGTPFWTGNCLATAQANYNGKYPVEGCPEGEYREKTVPVGSLGAANPFGLHDMHGNVWEWVQDCYSDSYSGAPLDGTAVEVGGCGFRVLRGGSWNVNAWLARSANRSRLRPELANFYYGFRVVVDLARTD